MTSSFLRLILVIVLLFSARPGQTQDTEPQSDWPFCPTVEVPSRPAAEEPLEPGDVHVLADEADRVEGGISHLAGNVQITRDTQTVRADAVDYDEASDSAELRGEVQYWDETVYLRGRGANLEFDHGTGTLQAAEYQLLRNRGRGSGDELYLDIGTETRGKNVDYTTCEPEAEGHDISSNAWRISAREITLNHDTERGSATHVVLRIKDVPVFYTPYLTFPLSKKRKSGFLVPGLGSTNDYGFEIRTPYYLNIAPQMDATLTPRILTDSGVMAMGEYRYLFSHGGGQLGVEYLPGDNKFDDKDRNLVAFIHDQTFADTGRLFMTYNRVSDKQYFEDFGNQIAVTSTRYLERRADLSYRGSWWRTLARVHDFQAVDDSLDPVSLPYAKLPQIRLDMVPLRGRNRLNVGMLSEAAYFDRGEDDLFADEVNGFRYDLYPYVSYPFSTRSTFLTPRIGVRFTQYDLEDSGPFKKTPSRILPIVSVDSGAFLEREFVLTDTDYVQTLEPRLYYLYVPDDDQSDLPVFETSIYNLSYASLFREDRFSSADRVGDANQFTLAFTSRLINRSNGSELGYVRVGQSYLLSDQDVIRQRLTPDGGIVSDGRTTDDTLGPVIGEFGLNLPRDWNLRGELHWEPNDNITEKMVFRAQYRPDDRRVLNLSYRVRRAPSGELQRNPVDIEQTDVSFHWPLGPQWAVIGRWNYAVPESKSLELFGGIEYESCCWGIRAVARRFLSDLDGDYSTGVFLQIELKGLAGIGAKTGDFLHQRIPGYETNF
ncbi:MAG: LPS-assembly protein LptD [Gammaproteobacteria bacterium]